MLKQLTEHVEVSSEAKPNHEYTFLTEFACKLTRSQQIW